MSRLMFSHRKRTRLQRFIDFCMSPRLVYECTMKNLYKLALAKREKVGMHDEHNVLLARADLQAANRGLRRQRRKIEALQKRISELETVCGETYQIVGVELWTGVEENVALLLDNLSAAANGTKIPHSDLLPWVSSSAASE